ncbi:MAG: hypothetical protein RL637_640 [Pseudomonadota bacterium]|jgi:hypothetical protein
MLKQLSFYGATALLVGASSFALAHTGVKDKVMEATPTYTAFTVGHGCSDSVAKGPRQDVIAVSAVFPNSFDASKSIVTKLDSTGATTATLPDLSADIVGAVAGKGFNLGIGLVAGGGTLFPNFIPVYEEDRTAAPSAEGSYPTSARGLHTWQGLPYGGAPLLESLISETGLVPFKVGSIQFNTASCAKSLKVRIAVANWCRRGPASKDLGDRVDVWMGHTTPLFKDQRTMSDADPAKATYWPTLTIVRDTTKNPLPNNCAFNADGTQGYDIAIEPTSADIDANLPIPTAAYPKGSHGYQFFP